MKIIVNADDLGYSQTVNETTFGLIERRQITSATLLTNAPWFEDAVARLRFYPHASFGVHLNLTEFAPLTRNQALRVLLDDGNCFKLPTFGGSGGQVKMWCVNIRKINIDSRLRQAIYTEWSAQVRRAIQSGVPVSHLDSHHYVHTIPKLFFVLKRVQNEFGIWKVRRSLDLTGMGKTMSFQKRLAKSVWNFALRTWGPTKTTDRHAGFEDFYSLLPNRLPRIETIELICHPGGEGSEWITRLIESPWRVGFEDHLQLINYNDL